MLEEPVHLINVLALHLWIWYSECLIICCSPSASTRSPFSSSLCSFLKKLKKHVKIRKYTRGINRNEQWELISIGQMSFFASHCSLENIFFCRWQTSVWVMNWESHSSHVRIEKFVIKRINACEIRLRQTKDKIDIYLLYLQRWVQLLICSVRSVCLSPVICSFKYSAANKWTVTKALLRFIRWWASIYTKLAHLQNVYTELDTKFKGSTQDEPGIRLGFRRSVGERRTVASLLWDFVNDES